MKTFILFLGGLLLVACAGNRTHVVDANTLQDCVNVCGGQPYAFDRGTQSCFCKNPQ